MATVRDEADARRQLRAERRRENDELVVAGPVTSGIELQYGGVDDAKSAIDARVEELTQHLETAKSLDVELANGKGPVAHWMRRSFAVRGGGLQTALQSYLNELATLRQTLDTVVAMHQSNDEEAATALPAGDVDA
ncbi:hypothetical protein SAMN05421837_101602 [Amycolatopsis pretoriensis]|uniref:Excreted virulence factor EspC, type VII ESX diderm n=1 Tax=Amycolatopsis pretoriensis TaxID=218821 RepID=A0A1H5Q4S2_9PSEU|nr:hypothetical protein [Amycolatopsis pretoriensis]SEF20894.1 hypothetical protein SAMN05421837_101602 [Amycolatopsis pretoriensis]